jgi:hypothetical protein
VGARYGCVSIFHNIREKHDLHRLPRDDEAGFNRPQCTSRYGRHDAPVIRGCLSLKRDSLHAHCLQRRMAAEGKGTLYGNGVQRVFAEALSARIFETHPAA